jgi:hypothetical protein
MFNKFLIALTVTSWPVICTADTIKYTFDVSSYVYEETVDGSFFMKDESAPAFYSVGVRNWSKPLEHEKYNIGYTAEYVFGSTDYTSDGTGTASGTPYSKLRLESYTIFQGSKNVTPYLGLGYRRLHTDGGGMTSSTGASAYDRLSQYYYLPIGTFVAINENLYIKAQYNKFLGGTQNTYLSDVSSAYSDIENDQNTGYGIDLTADYKISPTTSIYGYYRYWDINDSETQPTYYNGSLDGDGLEPANVTSEVGVGVAWAF